MTEIRRIINITNHTLTEEQVAEFREMYNGEVVEIVELPPELKKAWASINPCSGHVNIRAFYDFVEDAYDHRELDTTVHVSCVVQGESGATYRLVNALLSDHTTCFHATSVRQTVEDPTTGEKKSVFKHVMFREYE